MVTIKKDMRAIFLDARDQGPRPTCLAFALSDAHTAERTPRRSLSVDYLYYLALRRMPANHGDNGVGLNEAADALRVDGQPLETSWPYSYALPVTCTTWASGESHRDVCIRDDEFIKYRHHLLLVGPRSVQRHRVFAERAILLR